MKTKLTLKCILSIFVSVLTASLLATACEDAPGAPTITSVTGATAGDTADYYVVQVPESSPVTVEITATGQTPCPTDAEKCTCQYNSDKQAPDIDGGIKYTFTKPSTATQSPADGNKVQFQVSSATAPGEYKFKVTELKQNYKACSQGWSGGVSSKSNTQASNEVTILVCQVNTKFAKQTECDGNSLDVDLEVLPSSVKSSISNGNFTCQKPGGGTSFKNPSGQGSQMIPAGGGDYTKWKIDNVRWYSTQPDHCNETSPYEVVGTIKIKGVQISVTKGTFTASTAVGKTLNSGCFFGRAKPESVFDGDPSFVTVQVDATHWETTVSAGTFVRNCVAIAEVSGSPDSQFYNMIWSEENAHVTQFQDPGHAVYGKVFLASNIITAVTSKNPYRSLSSAQKSREFAEAAWNTALNGEVTRSNTYLKLRECDIEKEAKQQAGSSFCFTVWCAYGCK